MATQEKPETSLTPQNWYSRCETQGPTYAGQRFEKHLEKTQPNIPIGSMGLGYLPTFTIKINQMWVNIPYMDPMG